MRVMLRHRAVVTVALVSVLLTNLLVIGRVSPADPTKGDLPLAARCQGGGPGCAEQPMLPAPVGGMPQFDTPPAPAFGALVMIHPAPPSAPGDPPPASIERPPALSVA